MFHFGTAYRIGAKHSSTISHHHGHFSTTYHLPLASCTCKPLMPLHLRAPFSHVATVHWKQPPPCHSHALPSSMTTTCPKLRALSHHTSYCLASRLPQPLPSCWTYHLTTCVRPVGYHSRLRVTSLPLVIPAHAALISRPGHGGHLPAANRCCSSAAICCFATLRKLGRRLVSFVATKRSLRYCISVYTLVSGTFVDSRLPVRSAELRGCDVRVSKTRSYRA